MKPEPEIRRLLDVMPASGRMMTKIVSKPVQRTVIEYRSPQVPWLQEKIITINFELWSQLSQPKRDLLILRAVGWLKASNWFKPELYQGVVVAGLVGSIVELVQADAVGVVLAGGLSAIAASQIWRGTQGIQVDLQADASALQVAQRRGYTEVEAAKHLLSAIQTVARIEDRTQLDFNELIRCQNLRAIAGLSPESVPEALK